MNKLLETMVRTYNRIPKKLIDVLYLTAFALVLIYDYAFLTRFDRGPFRVPYIIGAAIAGIVLMIRFLHIKSENKLDVCFATVMLFIGGSYLLVRHSFYFLVLSMLIVGAVRVEKKKILAVYLFVSIVFFLVMFIHFLTITPEWKNMSKIHFGSINSTDCQGMLFFILVAWLFYRDKQVSYVEIAVLTAVILWFWRYTQADLNMICSVVCLLIAFIMKTSSVMGKDYMLKSKHKIGYVFSASFLLCAAVMIGLSFSYNPDERKWRIINDLLHQRLESPHRVFALYPPSFWGSEYTQNGWGYEPGTDVWMTIKKYGYTYIDSSYPNILLNHGYLVFFLIMSIMTVVPYQYAKEGKFYLVLLLAIIAIDCAAEGHLKEISCNVWMLFPFSYKNEKHRVEKIRTEMEY